MSHFEHATPLQHRITQEWPALAYQSYEKAIAGRWRRARRSGKLPRRNCAASALPAVRWARKPKRRTASSNAAGDRRRLVPSIKRTQFCVRGRHHRPRYVIAIHSADCAPAQRQRGCPSSTRSMGRRRRTPLRRRSARCRRHAAARGRTWTGRTHRPTGGRWRSGRTSRPTGRRRGVRTWRGGLARRCPAARLQHPVEFTTARRFGGNLVLGALPTSLKRRPLLGVRV